MRSSRCALVALLFVSATGAVNAGHHVDAASALAGDLFFSEYVEGTSFNKAVEIYNGTGAPVVLTGSYDVQISFNGGTSTATFPLTGTVADGDVWVLANTSVATPSDPALLAQADQVTTAGFFNGDDAVILRKGGVPIDVIGQVGFRPATEWGSGLTSTADNTLVRDPDICAGDAIGSDPFDPAIEWTGFATNTFSNLGSHVSTCAGDLAPTVTSTTPADGATGVQRDADLVVGFSEAVNLGASPFTIVCGASGVHTYTVAGGPLSFTISPDADFAASETCTVTVDRAQVADQDGDDPPDTMAADHVFGFLTTDAAVCGDPATLISTIQGDGATSALAGQVHTIEGVVVGDYQAPGSLSGFFVQEEDGDNDSDTSTSEGVFVFNTSFDVAAGDAVRVTGEVFEFVSSGQPLTELRSVSSLIECAPTPAPTPATVLLPVPAVSTWESFEGMLVSIPQELTVTETFTLGRFGEVALSAGGRLPNPTNVVAPGAPALARQDLNDRSRILLDDANNQQNVDPTLYPAGGLSATNTLRSGDTVASLTGVLEQRFGTYRVQPVGPVSFDPANPRPAAPPAVGGTLRVASFNVLNYFNGDGTGGGFPTARGASTALEFTRQRDKIVNAIVELDADVVGLMEMENDAGPLSAIADLVAGLNAATAPGTYAYIDTGVVGTDAIRVALIYQPAAATPVGSYQLLDSTDDPRFVDTLNRPTLAQTFAQPDGAELTVVVNHLKSKGSDCDAVGDPDTGDGQGNCNLTRTAAVEAMVDWLAGDPTGSGDADVLVIGDLNSYAMEDPITTLSGAGYTNLIGDLVGPAAYSYVFQGQSGYLDHALASPTLTGQVAGVGEWHINADEPVALDYNTEFKTANHVTTLYSPAPYRSSDHDPVLVGLDLRPTYAFDGFGAPIRPGTNVVNAGRAIPIKFGLGGAYGLDVFVGGPFVQRVDCSTGAPIAPAEVIDVVGGGLTYDAATGTYSIVWKTAKSLAGTCQLLVVALDDGTRHTALFAFR